MKVPVCLEKGDAGDILPRAPRIVLMRRNGQLHQLFLDLRDEFGQTFVVVTHNTELARLADKTIEMKDGKIISC